MVQTRPLLRNDLDDHSGSASSVAAQAQLIQEHQGSATVAPSSSSGGQPQQQGGGAAGANEEWNLMFGGPGDHEVQTSLVITISCIST